MFWIIVRTLAGVVIGYQLAKAVHRRLKIADEALRLATVRDRILQDIEDA